MSFGTSQPVVNRFTGTTDVATAVRTALLATTASERPNKLKNVSQSIRSGLTANNRIHPLRLARIMRRGAVRLFVLDLVN